MNFINLFPTLDLFILFLFVVAIVLHLIFIKKTRLVVNVLAIYISFIIVVVVPLFSAKVNTWLQTYSFTRAVAMIIVYFVLSFLLAHSNLGEFSKQTAPSLFSTSLVYRVTIVGLLFTTVLFFMPQGIKQQFGSIVYGLFMNLIAMFVWFIIPLFLVFSYRFKTRRGWID